MKSTSGLYNADLSRQRLNCFRPEAKIPENGYVKDWVWWRESRWGRSVFKRDRERKGENALCACANECARVQESLRLSQDGWVGV